MTGSGENRHFGIRNLLVRRLLPLLGFGIAVMSTGLVLALREAGWDPALMWPFRSVEDPAVICWLLGLASILLVPLLVLPVLNHASLRMRALGRAMHAVAKGDLDCELDVTGEDEVAQLMADFNAMAGDLRQSRLQVQEKNEQLRATLAELRRLDKTRHDVLTLISHEIRTPLTAIKGGMEYLRKAADEVPEAGQEVLASINLQEILDVIAKNTLRLDEFMNDATVMANLQAVNRRVTITAVPAGALVSDLLADKGEKIDQMALSVSNELQGGTPWDLLGDMDMMGTALEKLLENALDHNVPGGRVVIREVDGVPGLGSAEVLRSRARGGEQDPFAQDLWQGVPVRWRVLEIFNTGAPIPEDRRGALFSLFEMVGPMSNHQRGSGLSLPIARMALERMGGGIFYSSCGDEGHAFYLLVPTVDRSVAAGRRSAGNLWHDLRHRFGGIALDEEINPWGQAAGHEVELADAGSGGAGEVHQS